MISICFFNNKGGVGKTTLICNLASYLSTIYGTRILVVDADPQCNATQNILSVELEDYYKDDNFNTLLKVLSPFQEGEVEIDSDVTIFESKGNRFQIDILPGHPRLSLMEDLLSRAWLEIGGTDLGGIRKTNWCHQLNRSFEDKYDLIVYDVGPSLGALNRSVLIGCDYFVTPMGCDIFSIMGVNNISAWLSDWHEVYTNSVETLKKRHKDSLERFIANGKILGDLSQKTRFAGYTVQQYITKSTSGVRRPTKAFEFIMNQIPNEVYDSFRDFIPQYGDKPKGDQINGLKLGDIPQLYSLVPLAQRANSPIFKMTPKDGIVGPQYKQIDEYKDMLQEITSKLIKNIGLGD